MAKFSPVPGTADIFPEESIRYRNIEASGEKIFSRYGFGELRTPIFEYTEVFQRGLGDDTEVVQKEMYTFLDRGNRSLTLRPEGTAGVMRALLNTDVMNGVEQRVYYHGSMFRGERPSAGRRREFHQIGVENVGRVSPEIDAECISMLADFLEEVGIKGAVFHINTRGVMSDRVESGKVLHDYFAKHINDMCPDCQVRLEKNVWRILDCKQENCKKIVNNGPNYIEYFSEESRNYFAKVLELLDLLNIKYEVDPLLVRGLDYYVHTVFEITHEGLGGQNAIAGGGRYELFLPNQNKPIKGVGFAAGIERLLMVQDALNVQLKAEAKTPLTYLVSLGDAARAKNFEIAHKLRKNGIKVAMELENKSMKAQMRNANTLEATRVIILGEDELAKNIAIEKNMSDSSQKEISLDDLIK